MEGLDVRASKPFSFDTHSTTSRACAYEATVTRRIESRESAQVDFCGNPRRKIEAAQSNAPNPHSSQGRDRFSGSIYLVRLLPNGAKMIRGAAQRQRQPQARETDIVEVKEDGVLESEKPRQEAATMGDGKATL